MKRLALMFSIFLTGLVACQAAELEPALLAQNQDRQPVQESMAQLLNGLTITIADDAFSASSELSVERARNASTERALGRDLGTPTHFRLWIEGGNCLLEHVESARTVVVDDLTCSRAP